MKGILGMEGSYDRKVDMLVLLLLFYHGLIFSFAGRSGILGSSDVLLSVCAFFG